MAGRHDYRSLDFSNSSRSSMIRRKLFSNSTAAHGPRGDWHTQPPSLLNQPMLADHFYSTHRASEPGRCPLLWEAARFLFVPDDPVPRLEV